MFAGAKRKAETGGDAVSRDSVSAVPCPAAATVGDGNGTTRGVAVEVCGVPLTEVAVTKVKVVDEDEDYSEASGKMPRRLVKRHRIVLDESDADCDDDTTGVDVLPHREAATSKGESIPKDDGLKVESVAIEMSPQKLKPKLEKSAPKSSAAAAASAIAEESYDPMAAASWPLGTEVP